MAGYEESVTGGRSGWSGFLHLVARSCLAGPLDGAIPS